jgi:uncharacterized membrane protein
MTDFEVWVYRGLILFLVSIVLAIVKTFYSTYKEQQLDVKHTLNQLSDSIDKVNETMARLNITLNSTVVSCHEKHNYINEKLNNLHVRANTHESILSTHDKEIAILKEKHHEK